MKNFDKPICWICGNPIEYINVRVDGTIFCSECGATLSESNCPKINLEDATKRKFNVLDKNPTEKPNILIELSAEEFDKLPTLSEVEIREALERGRRDRIIADANERGKAIKSSRGR
jgi:uncharacterized Zn finger protein (UPF0148 family)